MTKEPTPLHTGQMVPDFSLSSTSGRSIRISDYRNRSNLVLVFPLFARLPELQGLLHTLTELKAEFSEQEAQLLLVLPGSLEAAEGVKDAADFPFPILADEQSVSARFALSQDAEGQMTGVAYVVDRFGEIFNVSRTGEGDTVPAPEEVLDWLQFIEIQCPE